MQTLRDQFVNVSHIKAMVGANGLLSHHKPGAHASIDFNCKVRLLDEDQKPLIIKAKREWTGRQFFDEVCREVGGLAESDYFGLRYLDRKGERQWLDLRANLYQQLRYTAPCVVSFRVKHYPPRPLEDLRQDISRYFLYLQLRRDLQHGRLLCSPTDSQELAACVAQAELGDRCDLRDPSAAVTELRLLPSMTPQALAKVVEMFGQLRGYVPVEAEAEFLEKASRLDTYGVDPYPVKDQKGNTLYLGLTHEGVATFRGNRRSHLFKWSEITKFSYERRIFIIHVTLRDDTPLQRKKKHVLGFKCQSRRTAAAIWRWAIDRQYFFTLSKGVDAKRHKSGGGFLRRRNTFRFSGRSRQETLRVSQALDSKPQPQFQRRGDVIANSDGTSSCRHIPQKKDSGQTCAATLPRARSEQHPAPTSLVFSETEVCNGSAYPRSNGGASVQFLLTSTPVKSRPNLLLHSSADELSSRERRDSADAAVREVSVDEKRCLGQNQAKGISEPDLSQAPGVDQIDAIALTGVEVADPLVQAPLRASQVSITDSSHSSIDAMPKVTARRESAKCSKPSAARATLWAPLAQGEDLSDHEEVVKPVPCWKAAVVIVVVFSFLSLIGSVLVFEGEIHSSALNDLRSSSYMEGLYSNVYRPIRRRILG